MLRLEAKAAAPGINAGPFALERAVEKIAGVELQARLGRRDFERAAARTVDDPCRRLQTGTRASKVEVVIVAAGHFQLGIGLLDARTDRGGLTKIERCPVDWRDLSGRDQGRVNRGKAVSVDRHFVAE